VVASVCLEKTALEPELLHLPPPLQPQLLPPAFPSIDGITVCAKPHETILTMMKQDNGSQAPYPLAMGWRPSGCLPVSGMGREMGRPQFTAAGLNWS
jgi:hypothetical protein